MTRGAVLVVSLFLVTACGGSAVDTGRGQTSTPPAGATTAQHDGRSLSLAPSEGLARSSPDPDAPVEEVVAGFNDAGFRLWRTQDIDGNVVLSPLSIGHTLLMARAAADVPTGSAIDEAFRLPPEDDAHEAWNVLDGAIRSSAEAHDEIVVTMADKIWPRLDIEPDQQWIDLLAAQHGATVEALDYDDPAASRDIINQWVAEQTNDLIPDLLPGDFLRPQTVLVLTNAIYFEAQWQTVFGKYPPVNGAFTRLDGSTTQISFMRELELADRRGAGDGFVGAELPYVGGEFSMLVIIPDEGRFEQIRHGLSQAFLNDVDATLTTGPYELLIPKWDTTTSLDLLPWLADLGAAPGRYPAISPQAFLAGAVHGADISVDEKGTIAAAATALEFAESGPPEPELTIRADKPYLYLIRHRPSGAVLFAGQVTDPTEQAP